MPRFQGCFKREDYSYAYFDAPSLEEAEKMAKDWTRHYVFQSQLDDENWELDYVEES